MSIKRRPWTEEDWTELKRLRAAGERWAAIDKALGRGPRTSRCKWENEMAKERIRADKSAGALRPAPAEYQSLTAAFFGDPLPGRSALDRRHAEAASRSVSVSGAHP